MNSIWTVIVAMCVIAVNSLAAQEGSNTSSKEWQEYAAFLPKDVYPDSGSRLPLVKREDLDDAGKKAFDATTSNPNTLAGIRGPVGIRMRSPGLRRNSGRETRYLRYESTIGRRHAELIILLAARAFDAQFEWTMHEPPGLKAGLEQEVIDVVKYNRPVTGLNEKDAALIQLGRETFGKTAVSSDTFARALKLFGEETLVEMVALLGESAATAILIHSFDQRLPPDRKPLLPIP